MESEDPCYQITWTASATVDLNELTSFIAEDDPDAARRVGHGLLEHVRLLEKFPFIGPTYPLRSGGSVREIVFRRTYRIFYSVAENPPEIRILRVWHGARGEPELPAAPG